MIQRLLVELRRVIAQVMARAAVPPNPMQELHSPQQLGFDFGAPSETPASPQRLASTTATSAMTSTNEIGTINHSRHTFGSSDIAPINGALSNAAVSGRLWNLGDDDAFRHSADGVPALSNGPLEPSPFAVPHIDVAPERVAPESVTPPKSRGRSAVRARTGVMFSRLQELGLRGIDTLVLMRTRSVMVSLIGQTLRVHEGYADAPEPVLRAIVTFATARHRPTRSAARDAILAHDVERAPATRRAEPAKPGDIALIASLMLAHREMNERNFGGALSEIPIRLSGRMATRLGHFDPGGRMTPSEIVMSRRHVVKHGWKEAMHTLLHEMVHQWQHETGQPVDHLAGFRKKCREVGITPAARREVTPLKARRQSGAA